MNNLKPVKPSYSEFYYYVDKTKASKAKEAKDIVYRYMWLDLDDDFENYKTGNVYKTFEQAVAAAGQLMLF